MITSRTRSFLVLLAIVACSVGLLAQGVTSSAVSGVVSTGSGEGLVGANVTLVHIPSGSRYGSTTRDDGRYNVTNLRPGGPYTIRVTYVGYTTQERRDVYVQLGQEFRIDFKLTEQAVEGQEVVVVGQTSSILSPNRTGAASTVVRDQLDKLPSITRNFEDYYKLSPYFSGSNAAGRNNKYNNIQIDGANYNDLFGLGGTTPASQSRATPISLDAIEQFQIEVSPYDVRKAGFTGAGINAITRSGGNDLTGSAFYYGRNESFIGVSPTAAKSKLPSFADYQAGFRLGGPIIKDELFFFANGEITRYKAPLIRTFDAAAAGTNTFTLAKDTVQRFANILKSKYGYDAGTFDQFDDEQNSDKIFARLDWNITDEHRLTLRHSYLSASLDNSPSRGRNANDIFFSNNRYQIDNTTNSTALLLKSVFGSSMANELIVAYTSQFDKPVIKGQPFPMITIEAVDASNRPYNILAGAEQFRHRNELDQKVLEISDNFTYYWGDHTLTAGVRLESFEFRNLFIPNNFGTYRFVGVENFNVGVIKANSYEYQYALTTPQNPTADQTYAITWSAVTYGGYVQDEWQVMPNLRLTLGARFDMPTYPQEPAYNKKVDSTFASLGIATNKVPESYLQISPRAAFNWDLFGDRSTQVRGGVGIFSGRIPYVWVSNQYGNTGVEYARLTGTPTSFSPNPFNQPGPGSAGLTATTTYEIDITNPEFRNPSVLRTSLALDQALPFGFVGTVEAILTSNRDEIVYSDLNLKDHTLNANGGLTAGGRVVGEGREVWGSWNAGTRRWTRNVVNSTFTNVIYLKNTDQGSQANYSVQLNRNGQPDNIDLTAGYTWGQAKDLNSGNSTTAYSQWRYNPVPGNPNNPPLSYSAWDRRHRVYASVSYRYDWGLGGFDGLATTIGLFYNGQSGRGFSYVVNGDVNGDGVSDNDLSYVPKDANDVVLMSNTTATATVLPTTDAAYSALMAYIDADEYLSTVKGKMTERMGAREPWWDQLDLRLTQEIPTTMGQKVELYLDVLNVLNLINDEWGWAKFVTNQNTTLLTFHSFETTAGANYGKPRYVWTAKTDPRIPDNIASRWQMQFGARITF